MARKALAWLAMLGLVAPAGAQQAADDIPDNMDAFRQTPYTDDIPVTDEGRDDVSGVGGSGMAGTGEARQGELLGEVVQVQGQQLWLRHGGAVFPLELTQETRFTPDRRQALQAGQEVRARFTIEDDGYVVNAVEPVGKVPETKPPVER